jgi:hypothetical protein
MLCRIGGDVIVVVGVVVVGCTVAVDITEVSGVAGIRRTLPPVVSTATARRQIRVQPINNI